MISLAAARVNANLTQAEVAKAIGVNRATIISWEAGRSSPKSTHFRKLCKLYNISSDFIFLPDTLLNVERGDGR